MKKWKVEYWASFLIICGLFIGSWQLANHFYTKELVDQQEEFLSDYGKYLISRLDKTQLTAKKNQRVLDHFSSETTERLTLLNARGRILHDTTDPQLTGNRANRPEVHTVLAGSSTGASVRKSATLKKELLYTALPIEKNHKLLGVLRLAKDTAAFAPKTTNFRHSIFIVLLIFYLILYAIIAYLFHQRNRPVETVLPVLKRMVAEPEKSNFVLQNSPQWKELYRTVNQLSEQLNETYAAYTSTEKQFTTLFHELMIGVFIIDEAGRFVMINKTMEELLSVGGATGQSYWQVIEDPNLIRLIQQVSTEKNQLHQEIAVKTPRSLNLDVRLRYLANPAGAQIMGTVYDLTHVRNLEKIQRDFVGNVSHELKTPVTSLIGFTETLLDGAMEDPALTKEFLTIMQKDAQRLQHLIQDIIELSKNAEHVSENQQTVLLYNFIQQQVELYERTLSKKQIQIIIDGSPTAHFKTQPTFFQPIIKNLIENAIQYSPVNSQILITFTLGASLELKVQDFGIGISKADQARIFERFYRVDKARSRHSGGTGLGLSIVKEYSEILGGTVTVESHPNVGSTFTVTLPNEK
ncbi:sensor histidine kinase [Enterococcus sp. CSURQ0835]|uniref:sensor histidine kinase n=1 Tax=Enterococcus sp. CSURQ0835 TaxID=2681394 RepID=UPI00135A9A4B|nr:ATP-binding protein [Enterococcus sp. CSURQ0835]